MTRLAVISTLVSMTSLSAGCVFPDAPAQEILRRTIPPGDATPTLSGPVRSAQSIMFTWSFNTHLTPAEYGAWLKDHLRDFEMVQEAESRLSLTKRVDGDAYRLLVITEPGSATTHVQVQLAAAPD